MPQFDTSFYFSQIFWLVLCLGFLLILVKRVFIPRMNTSLFKRKEDISKYTKVVENLEKSVNQMKDKISELEKKQDKMITRIIETSNNNFEQVIENQSRAVQEENESLIGSMRFRLRDEIKNIESSFKSYVDDIAVSVYEKIFSNKTRGKR
ncbi:MAG: hypothetical protein LBI26_01695 [Holosporales bacterium]|jgi:F-type H+-transporting ATPase subunit b|nr:hypothetical protein [Holosporales bacterium]